MKVLFNFLCALFVGFSLNPIANAEELESIRCSNSDGQLLYVTLISAGEYRISFSDKFDGFRNPREFNGAGILTREKIFIRFAERAAIKGTLSELNYKSLGYSISYQCETIVTDHSEPNRRPPFPNPQNPGSGGVWGGAHP